MLQKICYIHTPSVSLWLLHYSTLVCRMCSPNQLVIGSFLEEATYTESHPTNFVNSFLVLSIEDSMESVGHKFVCHLCKKTTSFVTMKSLKKHLSTKYPSGPKLPQLSDNSDDNKQTFK